MTNELRKFKKELREAVANYMRSEGCACCQDYEGHKEHAERLGKLLNVPRYSDGSGREFSKYQSKKTKNARKHSIFTLTK